MELIDDKESFESALREVATLLKTAPRSGADIDSPEGSRYVVLSDTLANQITAQLEEILRLTNA